jgi:hypothetical protein
MRRIAGHTGPVDPELQPLPKGRHDRDANHTADDNRCRHPGRK